VLLIWGLQALAPALLLLATGFGILGYSLIRLTARRQAILDYFEAWRSPQP
jgi:hypothetical protein